MPPRNRGSQRVAGVKRFRNRAGKIACFMGFLPLNDGTFRPTRTRPQPQMHTQVQRIDRRRY